MYELGLKGSMTAHDRVPGVIPSRNQTSSSSSARNYDVTKGEYVTPKSQAEVRRNELPSRVRLVYSISLN